MPDASCHCGAIRIRLDRGPDWVTACNCSICRRYGVLWAYCHPSAVTFTAGQGGTVAYLHNERRLEFHHCPACGCVTHWEMARKDGAERMAVNARLMEPEVIAEVPVRLYDGAATCKYIE